MVAWGCAVWGTRLVLPAVLGLRRRLSRTTTRTTRPTATAPRTTRGPAPTAAARSPTVRTAAPASAPATTRAPAPTRAARRPTGPYGARGAGAGLQPAHRHLRRRRARARTSTAAGASTAVQRGDQWAHDVARDQQPRPARPRARPHGSGGGAAVTPHAGRAATPASARTGSGDVYAGRDGNVYRNDGGSWQKYDNGYVGSRRTAPRAQAAQAGARPRPATRAGAGGPAGALDHDGPAQPRLAGAHRGRAAHARLQQLPGSGGSRSSGSSYRPSGGSRGGGGARRRRPAR